MHAFFVVISLALNVQLVVAQPEPKTLAQVIQSLPDTKLDVTTASQLAQIVIDESGTALDPFILIAQAYIESRFDPTATSRLVNGSRRTGSWPSTSAPVGWRGTLYCGITQTVAVTWAACLALRAPRAAIAAQAHELRAWLVVTRGSLPAALNGYGCGHFGVKHGCNGYAGRVRALAARLRRAARQVG